MTEAYDMGRVHEASLTILKEIDRIYRKYNICYVLDTGTLTGTVCRKGLIPWDDDADVAFTRNQCETLVRVASGELPDTVEFLELDNYRGGKAFYDFTPRIIYKKSKYHKGSLKVQYYEGKLNHIWVDLFILDELPSSRAGTEFTRFLHKAVCGMAMGRRYKLDFGKYNMIHKVFMGRLTAVGRLVPMKLIFAIQKAAALKDRHSKGSLHYCSDYQLDYLYVTMNKSRYDQVEDANFEDARLMIPKGWHQILTEVYGNYMEVPSEDRRVPTHSNQQIHIFDQNVLEQRADTHWGDDGREIGSMF